MKSLHQQYEAKMAQQNVDHQSNINELEFRLAHQESQHQNELSDLEAHLREEFKEQQRHEEVSKYSKVVRDSAGFISCSMLHL